jgi:hypothetical protein
MLGYNFDVLHKTMHNAGMGTSENFGKAKFAFWGFSEVRSSLASQNMLCGDVPPSVRMICFYRVRRILILRLFIMTCLAIWFMVGCGSGGSQGQGGQQEHTTHHQNASLKLNMHPEGNFGVSGTASFEDTSDGVLVKLELRGLPKPNTLYLAHIHPGTCTEGESHEHGAAHGEGEYGHEHGGGTHQHGGGTHEHGAAEIEYPLSQVKSDSKGRGSSTTTLHETSVDELFSGEPKHVNVHEAGSGNPPILSCADLNRAG